MPRWAAIIGSPVSNSLSPVLHQTAYVLAGLDWEYRRIQVEPGNVAEFLRGIDQDCVGLSVTMPCKQEIIGLLDTVESLCKAVGAVNTVVRAAGMLTGFNTDVHGIVSAVTDVSGKSLAELSVANRGAERGAVILGTRATASSALAAATSLGFQKITIVGRSFQGPGTVLMAGNRLGVQFDPLLWKQREQVISACQNADLLISTVPDDVSRDLVERLFPRPKQTLLDVTYSTGSTALSERYRSEGAKVSSPLRMLVHQGLAQVKLMSGKEVPFEPVYQAVLAASHGAHP